MKDFEAILYEVERGRARITLNRPEKLNALSNQLLNELHEALWEADEDTEVHAVVIRGAGRSFSAGYDLAPRPPANPPQRRRDTKYRGARSFDDDTWQLERAQRMRMAIFDMHKPVIAQVHGHCLAGGTDVALLCDMVIAADDAKIGFPPARDLGALPNNMWLYNAGPQWAKRLLLTGDTITGAEAAEIGLVLKAVPADLLEAEVRAGVPEARDGARLEGRVARARREVRRRSGEGARSGNPRQRWVSDRGLVLVVGVTVALLDLFPHRGLRCQIAAG